MTHRTELTVKEFAAHERVTERTVRTWVSKGAVPIRRTPGGYIRILVLTDSRMKSDENLGSPDR